MPDAVKAAHYIQQLDDARCNENWDAVPELIRKVRKHAPDRVCLTLTAEIEHSIAKANLKPTPSARTASAEGNARPSSSSTAPAGGLEAANHLPDLFTAIDAEAAHPEDRFQARVCAGWLLWVLREYPAALARLPRTLHDKGGATTTTTTNNNNNNNDNDNDNDNNNNNASPDGDGHADDDGEKPPSEWTRVCGLKAAYLRANCLARDGQREGALDAFEAALPGLSAVWAAGPADARPQTRYWAELFLTECCMLAAQALREGARSLTDPNCLACFRAWARYWAAGKGGPSPGGYGFRGSVPRRQVWGEYYSALSGILQGDLPFPTGGSTVADAVAGAGGSGSENSARVRLRTELKKVEAIYQGLLYSETKFPRADEERTEVEDFVRRLMQNWEVLNGRGWKEHELGAGGRDALCHATLDSLYGAAAKTYHSTAILRHMFTVHLAVAEFDLAFKAFDSWLDLVKKGKARVKKTGHREPALDGNATMFETISTCIAALCRFGGREAAEKAHKLAEELAGLVAEEEEKEKKEEEGGRRETDNADPLDEAVPPATLAVAWQSIGLARAQWARMTFESDSRAALQEKAIQCLRKSLSPAYGNGLDARGVFALGMLYAEQRKLSASIEIVKTALLAERLPGTGREELRLGPYWREKSLIPLWHLLALALSARQEFVMAARACEGAVEQFKDPHVLFGSRQLTGGYRSEHLKEAGIKDRGGDGLVDEMDDYEKEGILQIKMTQLAILEVIEGPAVAVNASTELLTLFPRLFGDLDQKVELSRAEPPKTSGTMRSLRGSVFGGKSDEARPKQQGPATDEGKPATTSPRPRTTQSVATTGQSSVNDPADPYSSRRSTKSEDMKRSRNSLRKRDRSGSRQRAFSTGSPRGPPPLEGDKSFAAFDERNLPSHSAAKQTAEPPREDPRRSTTRSRAGTASQAEVRTGQVSGTFSQLLPFVTFSPDHGRRRRKAILTKVWLVIAGFYRRAGLLDDAGQAISEAQRAAEELEADVMNEASGAMSVRQAGWGMEKSSEEVIADVWAEKGNLWLARGRPYQARADFETALTHFPDHPGAIVGLSNILLDIHTEKLLPPPAVPGLDLGRLSLADDGVFPSTPGGATITTDPATTRANINRADKFPALPSEPLGLGRASPESKAKPAEALVNGHSASEQQQQQQQQQQGAAATSTSSLLGPPLPPPHEASSLPLNDRLAARDRAFGLLSGLTKLGSGWNHSEAWFTLARAYEESGQLEKARDALWWCIELEDGRGVREWDVVRGGYVL
ncbi:uncharacterized protein P884DRAFT_266188 [Thermothelomyces heterothallicus CBS 202.75]|uniref:uncharacterized protein n=1 Tax=Thermothelomyces heterothallicus CBS 202.75 TaxID=1149848 RepID=UPI003742D264